MLRGNKELLQQVALFRKVLPSTLEGKGPFSHVVVKSAALSRTSGGAITEFKAELTLRREPSRP